MPIIPKSLSEFLSENQLRNPWLNCLIPDNETYSVQIFQPLAELTASNDGVKNANAQAAEKYRRFFDLARTENTNIAVTPEYSCPWDVLEECIQATNAPQDGNLWIVGCESIKPEELAAFKTRIETLGDAVVLYAVPTVQAGKHFLDPACYLFRALNESNESKIVCVVQFKICPMAEQTRFEQDNLICGDTIYLLQNGPDSPKLMTLICSDSLQFRNNEDFATVYRDTIFFHLQLNPKPRNDTFRRYRDICFDLGYLTNEIYCANWSLPIKLPDQNVSITSETITGTAIYCRSEKVDKSSQRINHNHERGLYFSYWPLKKAYVSYFTGGEHVFRLRSTKGNQGATLGVHARHTGPEMLSLYSWTNYQWVPHAGVVDDGSSASFSEYPTLLGFHAAQSTDPTRLEQIITMACGFFKNLDKWHHVENIESFCLDNSEAIRRLTFTKDVFDSAVDFRTNRFRTFSAALGIISDPLFVPVQLAELGANKQLFFEPTNPAQNIVSADGTKKGTFIFAGHDCSDKDLSSLHQIISEIIHRSKAEIAKLVVCYFSNGERKIYKPEQRPQFTDPKIESPISTIPNL